MSPADIVIPVLLVAWAVGTLWLDRLARRARGHGTVFTEADADAAAGRDPLKGNVTRYHVAAIALLVVTAVLVLLAERFLA